MNLRQRIDRAVHGKAMGRFITGVILFNAVILGLETSATIMRHAGGLIIALDRICLAIFVVEIAAKLVARGPRFFRDGWNVFDFVIVGVALMPATQGLSVLRSLRILRLLRIVSVTPRLRRVVEGFLAALPGMASVFVLLAIFFYIFAVIATKLFGPEFPDWFGTLGRSAYSLFQIMTLDSWSSGFSRTVMQVFPWAWLFFLPFVLITAFVVMNLVIGLIVNSLQEAHQADSEHVTEAWRDQVLSRLEAIETRLSAAQANAGHPAADPAVPPAKDRESR